MALGTDSMKSPEGKATVKILRSTIVNGKSVAAGDVIEISAKDARFLIRIKKAEACNPVKKNTKKKATKSGDD